MTKLVQMMRARREFSTDFKRSLVSDFEKGKFTIRQLSAMYHISFQNLYRWVYQYSTVQKHDVIMVEKAQSSTQKLKEYEKKIAALERALGQKQIQIDYLETLIEVAQDTHKIDIKKNANT